MTILGYEVNKKDDSLFAQWMEAKARESQAASDRRAIEDSLAEEFALNEQNEGSKTHKLEGYVVKITQRMNRKVESVPVEG